MRPKEKVILVTGSTTGYSICKGGLMTLTRNLADAYGAEGIRVNQMNVGWTLS